MLSGAKLADSSAERSWPTAQRSEADTSRAASTARDAYSSPGDRVVLSIGPETDNAATTAPSR